MPFVKDMMLVGLLMTIEEIQKYLDDNDITFEDYIRKNVYKEFVDKVWMTAIYGTLEEPSQGHFTDPVDAL